MRRHRRAPDRAALCAGAVGASFVLFDVGWEPSEIGNVVQIGNTTAVGSVT